MLTPRFISLTGAGRKVVSPVPVLIPHFISRDIQMLRQRELIRYCITFGGVAPSAASLCRDLVTRSSQFSA